MRTALHVSAHPIKYAMQPPARTSSKSTARGILRPRGAGVNVGAAVPSGRPDSDDRRIPSPRALARPALRRRATGHEVVVVVSAMAGETNRLLALAKAIARAPDERESDALVATGEQVTAALTALALADAGVAARSFLGHQVRIETDSAHGRARIVRVDVERLRATLAAGAVAVVAGFQGVDGEGSITTLGRGGSDTSAVALAAALGAAVCEIYTDGAGACAAYERDEGKLTVLRVPDRPGLAARVFGPIARANIVVDMIIQSASADGTTDLTFTVPRGDYEKAKGLLEATAGEVGAKGV